MSDDKKDEGQIDDSGLLFTGKLTVDNPLNSCTFSNTKFHVSLSNEIIQALTKQADLEASAQMNILRNSVTMIHSNTANMAMNIEGTLRTNFPAMHIPSFPLNQPYPMECAHEFLNGTDMGSILTRGKLLSAVVSVGGMSVDYEGSVDSMFKRHFVYTNYKDPRKQDLNNLSINYFEVTEEDNLVSFKKAEPFIEGSKECLWWDNAPVDINLRMSDKTACLSFANGRKMEVRISELKSAVEIDYNVNLMLARFIEANYKFYDLVDNPINSYDKVVYRSFLEDAKSIYEENKNELSEMAISLAKIYRKHKSSLNKDQDLILNDEPNNRVLLLYGNHYVFEKYNIKVTLSVPDTWQYFTKQKEDEINYDELNIEDWDHVGVNFLLHYTGDICYSREFCIFRVKNTEVEAKEVPNSNLYLSNYLVKTLLEEYKRKISLFYNGFIKA